MLRKSPASKVAHQATPPCRHFHRVWHISACRRAIAPRAHASAVDVDVREAYCFDFDSTLCDLAPVVVTSAFRAAQQLWPDRVVGTASLYVAAARRILPAIAHPYQAVILIRLLADEGVIGARSTAGREGPVVGRAVRRSGSRPMLVAEIAEHWPTVLDSCLLRWALDQQRSQQGGALAKQQGMPQSGVSSNAAQLRSALLDEVRTAYAAAQLGLALDDAYLEVHALHPSGTGTGPAPPAGWLQDLLADVVPHATAVEALKGRSAGGSSPSTSTVMGAGGKLVYLLSSLPQSLTRKAIARCGLTMRSAIVVHGPSWEHGVAKVVGMQGQSDHVHFITGNLGRLEELAEQARGSRERGEATLSVAALDGRTQPQPAPGGGVALDAAPSGQLAAAAYQQQQQQQQPAQASSSSSSSFGAEHRPDGSGCADGGGVDVHKGLAAQARPSCAEEADAETPEQDVVVVGAAHSSREWVAESGSGWSAGASGSSSSSGRRGTVSSSSSSYSSNRAHRMDGGGDAAPAGATSAGNWNSNSSNNSSDGSDGGGSSAAASMPFNSASSTASSSSTSLSASAPCPRLTVHLAEWSCPNISFRARALSLRPDAQLLSETELAELLGVTHLRRVMDGIEW